MLKWVTAQHIEWACIILVVAAVVAYVAVSAAGQSRDKWD